MQTVADLRIANDRGSAARAALWVLIAVLAVLFAQFIHAYVIRLNASDWRALPELPLLKFNTAVLLASSAALQWASHSAARQRAGQMRAGLLFGAVLALVFLAGQWEAWQQLAARGYLVAGNPANSFFYLITGLHGAHVIGGLIVLAANGIRAWSGTTPARMQISMLLTARYWHFLLVVWLVLYALLFHGTPTLIQTLCGVA